MTEGEGGAGELPSIDHVGYKGAVIKIKGEREKNIVNSGHYILSATPKVRACASLGPKYVVTKNEWKSQILREFKSNLGQTLTQLNTHFGKNDQGFVKLQ